MGLQPFGFGHGDYGAGEAPQSFAGELLDGHLAHEAVDVDPAERAGPAAGGQCVVGPGGVVAGAFGRIAPHEDASGGGDAGGDVPGPGGVDDEVLGGIGFGECHCVVIVPEDDCPAAGKGSLHEGAPVQGCGLQLDLPLHLLCEGAAAADQHHLAVHPVLRLRKQVCRHEGGGGVIVRYHHHFGRSRRHVDSHPAEAEHLLGGGDVAVAGAEDLVHAGDGGGAVCHGRCSLGSADPENPLDTTIGCGVEHFRRLGGSAKYHFGAACDAGGYGQHQYGREEGSGASRDVQADFGNGDGLLYAFHSGSGFHHHLGRALSLVESFDIGGGLLYGSLHFGADLAGGGFDLGGGEFQRGWSLAFDFQGEFPQGPVPAQAHPFEYGAHAC